jgi:hypothetical protein
MFGEQFVHFAMKVQEQPTQQDPKEEARNYQKNLEFLSSGRRGADSEFNFPDFNQY